MVMDVIKNAFGMAKAIGNIELQKSLIDVQQQILDMQQVIEMLREENKRLTDISALEAKIERNPSSTIVTLSDETPKINYCSHCWDSDRKLVQICEYGGRYISVCPNPNCGNKVV
jgi:hypothetical protein